MKLPVGDRTPSESLTRMGSISKQYAELPNMPGTNKTFVAGKPTRRSLTRWRSRSRKRPRQEKIAALAACEMQFKGRAPALNLQDDLNASFIAAALKQGRGQFPEGTQERKLIEAIATPAGAVTAMADEAGDSTNTNPNAGSAVAASGSSSAGSPSVSVPTPVCFVTSS